MKKERINEIKQLLNSVPPTPWIYRPGDAFDHWEIWSGDQENGRHLVQDDSGIDPDEDFIKFVLLAKDIIKELLSEIDSQPERSKREDQIKKHSFLGPVRKMTRPDLDAVL